MQLIFQPEAEAATEWISLNCQDSLSRSSTIERPSLYGVSVIVTLSTHDSNDHSEDTSQTISVKSQFLHLHTNYYREVFYLTIHRDYTDLRFVHSSVLHYNE
jgi:hypothetical protein